MKREAVEALIMAQYGYQKEDFYISYQEYYNSEHHFYIKHKSGREFKISMRYLDYTPVTV